MQVFGSVVRGDETPESDIDFLIDYDLEKITPWFPVGLIHDLQDFLERDVDSEMLMWYLLNPCTPTSRSGCWRRPNPYER